MAEARRKRERSFFRSALLNPPLLFSVLLPKPLVLVIQIDRTPLDECLLNLGRRFQNIAVGDAYIYFSLEATGRVARVPK